MSITYDAAKAAVDALERAMNGPEGSPAATRAALTLHAAVLADLSKQTVAKFQKTLAEAEDHQLCPSAYADHNPKALPFDPFDRAQRWTFVNILGSEAKERLAALRYEASNAALTAAGTRILQKLTPGHDPVAALSIVALSDALNAARCPYVALDFGDGFRPQRDDITTNVDDWAVGSGNSDPLIRSRGALVLPRSHAKQAVDLVRDQMTRSDPDATFRARVVWEQVAPARILRPASTMPFWLRQAEYTEEHWNQVAPAERIQIVRMTIDDTEPVPLYGPVQRLPAVWAMRLVLTWDEPACKGRGGRKGHMRIYGLPWTGVVGGTLDFVRVVPLATTTPKPLASGKPKTTKRKATAA
jgi:hypothetical protein